MSFPPVFLALGSNLGDREDNINRALEALGKRGFRTTARSALYETEPVGGPPQGPYLNAVVQGETVMAPPDLLEACLGVERDLGRVRTVKNGPRVIDVDLLLYGDLVLETERLSLPHPRFHERAFVLAPLAELAPHQRHPVLGKTMAELRAACPDQAWARPYRTATTPA